MIDSRPFRKDLWVAVLGILISLAICCGSAQARNPNLSNWTLNLSGNEPLGETWTDLIQEIEVVGDTVHVTYWATLSGTATKRLYYRRSLDGGRNWQGKILLYEYTGSMDGSIQPMYRSGQYLAVDGTTVHVAYAYYDPNLGTYNCQLLYRRSLDNGASFEPARTMVPDSGGWWWINSTRIAAHNGKVTIAFQYQPVDSSSSYRYVATLNSADGGATFARNEVANSGHRYLNVTVDDLKRVGDRIYLLYRQDLQTWYMGNWDTQLRCATSLNSGANFTDNLMSTVSSGGRYLTYGTQNNSYSPNIALDGDNVYVVWSQNDTTYDSNNISLYLRRSADQGLNFGAPIKMAQNQTDGIGNLQVGQETVAAKGGYVYLVFMTQDGTVYLRRSTDSGAGFLPLQTVGSGAWWPNLVVDPADGAKLHLFWYYTYRYSADGGAGFTSPVVLMPFTNGFGAQTGAQMALGPGDSKHLTVPWSYAVNYDTDIFYRHFTPAPAPSADNRALHIYTDPNTLRYDCMEVAGGNWLNFTSQMTGELWVKPYTGGKTTGSTSETKYIFCKVTDSTIPFISNSSYELTYTLGTTFYGGGDDQNRRQALAEIRTADGWFTLIAGYWNPIGLVPDNAWTHLAFTYDAGAGTNNFKLYKNGNLIASTTVTGNIKTGPGNFYAGAYGRWEMDELRLWSVALSETEIRNNMRKSLTGLEYGLNAYYQFSDTTRDQTGHGNDGILIYMESFVPSTLAGGASMPSINSLLMD